ncbi:MAG: efflux RND transporter periplasmic adaptor subunit [Desulfobacteraceae bacterium]|nr:efflux RND transporter periplasmic adaptor subunit [Desulfobacteraceae bacterium]MBC2719100.1 efflux RND transporter periplasmic adaptor subunit [Desulfobacteraceae bacterium]
MGKQHEPPAPVRFAIVEKNMVSNQLSLVGTTEAIAGSTVAAEVSGVVEYYPVKEGDFVKKDALLVRLRSTELKLRLKGAIAVRERIRANLKNAEKELSRFSKLKETNSIAARQYDEALYNHEALLQEFLQKEAEVDRFEYEIEQKEVFAPFSGFIAEEYTQVGEWIDNGGSVVRLVNLEQIRITVDVPERYVIMLSLQSEVMVMIKSLTNSFFFGRIYAVLPYGDRNARTFPVRINLDNPGYKIKSGMEAIITFNLTGTQSALLIPKDAVVTAGNSRLVFLLSGNKVMPVNVEIVGYYDGNVAVKGELKPGDKVVIRGNERLMPGQTVLVLEK